MLICTDTLEADFAAVTFAEMHHLIDVYLCIHSDNPGL